MKQKKLMLLGGIRYLLPVIQAAHEQGYYVITADYLPDNIAHKYSDEYVNVSIIDKEAVLKVAQEKEIDGIMSFGVDPGVVATSYVQEQMGLPSFGPHESVVILQNKDKFRKFLSDNGFNVPWAYSFSSVDEAWNNKGLYSYPLIVKPTDSAGSKGCIRVDSVNELKSALDYAIKYSISKHVIVEEFIEKIGCSSDSECFSVDGKLNFVSFSSQRFDEHAINPFVPAAFSWPSTFTKDQEDYLISELQRLFCLLKLKSSVFNVETRIGINGKPYIMEVSPRGGGNRLCEMLRYATGIDLIGNAVRVAMGEPVVGLEQKSYNGYWAEIILHSDRDGKFKELQIDELLEKNLYEIDLWVNENDVVSSFKGANNSLGTLVFRFEQESLLEKFWKVKNKYKIILK